MAQGDRFRRKALKRGYKVDEVDDFLDRAESTLSRRPSGEPVSASDVRDVVFRTRFGGYDEWQVDLHLDRLEKELEELSSGLPARGSNGFRALEAGPSAYRDNDRDFIAEREYRDEPVYDRSYREEPAYREAPAYDRSPAAYRDDRDYAEQRGYRDDRGAGYRDERQPYREAPAAYRDDRDYDREYARDDRGAPPPRDGREPAFARDTEYRREPDYRGQPGYHPDPREDRHYRDPETSGSSPLIGAAGLAAAGLAAGGVVPGAVVPGPGAPPRGGRRGEPHGGPPPGRQPFPESFQDSLPPARPITGHDPYGGRHGKDMTVEMSAVGGGGYPSPFTNEDKAAVAELRAGFRPRRFGSGYDPQQVERLFDAIQATLEGRSGGQISDSDLAPGQFGLVQAGYFEDDVDLALREVRALFARRMG